MEFLREELTNLSDKGTLAKSCVDVQQTINILVKARTSIASCRQWCIMNSRTLCDIDFLTAPETTSATLAKLQNPTKQSFDNINGSLRDTYTALGNYSKALDKV